MSAGASRALALVGRGLAVLGCAGSIVGGVAVLRHQPASAVPAVDPDVPVTAMDRHLALGSTSPTVVADPREPRFVVIANRLDARDFSCSLQLSGDGGRGWTTATPVTVLPPGAEKCYAPEVAFDADGTLHYLFVGLAGHGNQPMGVYLSVSTDRGLHFSRPRQVLGPLNFSVRMAIDTSLGSPGRIHLVWIHATDATGGGFSPSANPIMTAHSDDGGASFSTPIQISDRERSRVVAPVLVVAPDQVVHVGYYDLMRDAVDYQGLEGGVYDGAWSLVLTTSTDGGGHFQRGVVIDAAITPPERVMLIFTMTPAALVADGHRTCAAWADARYGDSDALLRCSVDGGRTWAAVRRLNDDRVGDGISQFMPRLGVSPEGRIDAIFYDRRVIPGNFVNDVFYTYSTDGGETFSANVRLTEDGSNSRIGAQYANASARGQWEFGSRIGLLSTADGVVAAWTDTRNSLPFSTGQDIFATTVHLPRGGAAGRVWTGGALITIGVVAGGWLAYRVSRRRRVRPESDG